MTQKAVTWDHFQRMLLGSLVWGGRYSSLAPQPKKKVQLHTCHVMCLNRSAIQNMTVVNVSKSFIENSIATFYTVSYAWDGQIICAQHLILYLYICILLAAALPYSTLMNVRNNIDVCEPWSVTHRVDIGDGGRQGNEHIHVGSTVLEWLEGRDIKLVPSKDLQIQWNQLTGALL